MQIQWPKRHATSPEVSRKLGLWSSVQQPRVPAGYCKQVKGPDRHLFWIHKEAPTSYYRPEFNLFNIPNTNDADLRHPVKSL